MSIKECYQAILMEQQRDTKEILLEPVWKIGIKKIVNNFYLDMFPHTTERAKTAVDQVGQTDRQMTYFLSSRAMWKPPPSSPRQEGRTALSKTIKITACSVPPQTVQAVFLSLSKVLLFAECRCSGFFSRQRAPSKPRRPP